MKKLFLFIFKNIIISIFSTLILIGIIFIIISVDTATTKSITKSVVKIDITDCGYDYDNPWQTGEQSSRTGSGCIIDENRILTNAHVISNNTYIQVKKAGEARKYTAYVDAISNESDLATLKVYDTSFFKNSQPIKVGVLPKYRDNIVVYGFPTGGDELSITEGVISRIEKMKYIQSSTNLLACQIDGTLKHGNSGGPVIAKDKIVGVAFQADPEMENK